MRQPIVKYPIEFAASKAIVEKLAKLAGVKVSWVQFKTEPKACWYEYVLDGDDYAADNRVSATLARLIREAKP